MAEWNGRIKEGDHVFHTGSKKNGVVKEVVPQRDGSAELRVDAEGLGDGDPRSDIWWPSYFTEVGEWDWSKGGRVFVTPLDNEPRHRTEE